MLAWLENLPFSDWVRDSLWGYAILRTIHTFGSAHVFGLTVIIALRISGLFRTISLSSLSRLFPLVWVGVVVQLVSGFALWMPLPCQHLADPFFRPKIVLVAATVIGLLSFQKRLIRENADWEAAGLIPRQQQGVIWVAFLLCAGVIIVSSIGAYLGGGYDALLCSEYFRQR